MGINGNKMIYDFKTKDFIFRFRDKESFMRCMEIYCEVYLSSKCFVTLDNFLLGGARLEGDFIKSTYYSNGERFISDYEWIYEGREFPEEIIPPQKIISRWELMEI